MAFEKLRSASDSEIRDRLIASAQQAEDGQPLPPLYRPYIAALMREAARRADEASV